MRFFFLIIGERHDTDTSVESYLIGLRREGEQNYIQRLCSNYKKIVFINVVQCRFHFLFCL